MRHLIKLTECPPEGYTYTHAETGHVTKAVDPWTWLEKAKEHRRANNLPVPSNLFEQMQEQLCRRLTPEVCTYSESDPQWIDTRMNWGDVIDASRIYMEWRKQGKPFVSLDEAERRAAICAGCYLNVRVDGCGGLCREAIKIITETNGERKTSYDSKLLNCAVCKCSGASQVHFPLDLLEKSDSESRQSQYPVEFCWKNKQSPNYQS